MIAQTFMEIADGLETGSFGKRAKIAVTGLGSEHGEANSVAAANLAADRGVDVTLGVDILQGKDYFLRASTTFNYNAEKVTSLFNDLNR